MKRNQILTLTIAALLSAVGILIPMISPFKIIIEPASFTIASHVATIIAMFISPAVAVYVSIITAIGFLLAGFPTVVFIRALSHVLFAFIGAIYLKKKPETLKSLPKLITFIILISILHALAEVIVVLPFYTTFDTTILMYNIFTLVGIGTVIHSCIDFGISVVIYKLLLNNNDIKKISTIKEIL